MGKLSLLLLLSFGTLYAQDSPDIRTSPRVWKASLASLAIANVMDVQSSWGKYETNPMLAGANGRFGARGALLKLALQGSVVGVEYLITRGHPSKRVYRLLTIVNFGDAAATAATAGHNYTIPR
jgi:hypothetical protein